MNETQEIENKILEYKQLLERYKSVGIPVEDEEKYLINLNENYALNQSSQFQIQTDIENFIISLKEKNNYYHIITTTKYINGSITSSINIEHKLEEYLNLCLDCLKRIENCDIKKLKEQNKILSEFYKVVLDVAKLEVLYSENHNSIIIKTISESKNQIHKNLLNHAIETNIEEIKNYTCAPNPQTIKNLENEVNRKFANSPFENLIDIDIIKRIVASSDYEKIKEIITNDLRRLLEEIWRIQEEIDMLSKKIEDNTLEIASKKQSKKKYQKSVTKLISLLLGVVTPLSILYYKNTVKVSTFMSSYKYYETKTLSYSLNNTYSESYNKVTENITWERKMDSEATRTLEVLGEVQIVEGALERTYNIYDISSYNFDIPLPDYINMYNEGELRDKLIETGTRPASVNEYKNSDINVTEVVQDLNSIKEETDKGEEIAGIIFLVVIGGIVDLIVLIGLMKQIIKDSKDIKDYSKSLKELKKELKSIKLKVMNLLNDNSDNIEKYKDLCTFLQELLEKDEISANEKSLIDNLETIVDKDETSRNVLTKHL